MNRILVIGADGFIGAHLMSFFRSKRIVTFGCDIIKVGTVEKDECFYVDTINPNYYEVLSTTKPTLVINASGGSNVQLSINKPKKDFNINVSNVLNLLESIKAYDNNCKFINLSSAAVYGNADKLPISEDCGISPKSPYGYHKYLSEILCMEYYNLYNVPTCSLRIFSVFGPGLQSQIFWDIYQKYKSTTNHAIELFGTGNETRDFIFIDDLVKAIYLIYINSPFNGETINVANSVEIKIKTAAKTFFNYLNPSIKIIFNNMIRKGDPTNWCADTKKLKSYNYVPRYHIDEGLKKYVDWLEEIKND